MRPSDPQRAVLAPWSEIGRRRASASDDKSFRNSAPERRLAVTSVVVSE